MAFKVPADRVMTEEEVMIGYRTRDWFAISDAYDALEQRLGHGVQRIIVVPYIVRDALGIFLEKCGNPVYHVGVDYADSEDWEDKTEVSFCPTGIYFCKLGAMEDFPTRLKNGDIYVGYTTKSRKEIEDIIESMRVEYPPGSYNLLEYNCHTFCNDLLTRLGCAQIPPRFTQVASRTVSIRNYIASFKPLTKIRNFLQGCTID